MDSTGRDNSGRFTDGNSAAIGHGRPRRPIEVDYARIMADAISLENWKAICDKAVSDAIAGDKHARDFITTRLLGDASVKPALLALRERHEITPDDELDVLDELNTEVGRMMNVGITPLEIAITKKARHAKAKR